MGKANTSISTDVESTIIKYSPFFSEIRIRLIFVLSVFIISAAVGFIYYEAIIRLILKIFALEGLNIVFTSPFQFISLAVNCALLSGFIVVLPIVIFQIISFVRPALKEKEYKAVLTLLPIAFFLFISGFSFGVLIMKYVVIVFFEKSTELNIGNFLDVSLFLSQVLLTAILMGLAFQVPIILTMLMKLKLVRFQQIVGQRILVYVLSLIFAALLPPTDLLSMVFLFLPLVFLFEITLLLNKFVLKSHLL